MSTENNPSTRFNILVAIVVAALAVVGAFITKFESDASTMSGLASNDEQRYYYQAMGAQISGDADTHYEFGTAYQLWYEYNLLNKGALQHGDQETARTYQGLRDALTKTSALLQAPYFVPETGQINLPRYKADTYTASVVELQESQRAASAVSSAWDEKSGTYVLQLTLLAVAGFLLGLALMTNSSAARLVFAGSGIPMVAIIAVWAYLLSVEPVFDLRQTGAIPFYAQGVSEAEQHDWEAALEKFDQAIARAGEEHPYAEAYLQRAVAHSELGNFKAAVRDYEKAMAEGASESGAAGGLVWALFQEGRFEEAIRVGQEALIRAPDRLWLRHRVSMALLASGDVQTATNEYKLLLDTAEKQIASEKSLGGNGSATLWQLKEASSQLDQLADLLEGDASSPVRAAIGDTGSVSQAARDLSEQILSASVALEYGQDLAAVKVDASISPLKFNLFQTADDLYVYKVDASFTFEGLQTGQLLTLKIFRNGVEELAWEFSEPWSQAGSGMATITLNPDYADVYAVAPGEYEVKIYVNGQFIQQGSFTVGNGAGLALGDELTEDFTDIYDAYDFTFLDIFFFEGDEDFLAFYYDDLFFFDDLTDDWYFLYEDLWLDEEYVDYEVFSVCDPDLDPDCAVDEFIDGGACDPDDPFCDLTEATCDPETDPDCAADEFGGGEFCDPDIDPDCTTDELGDEQFCDPDIDPDCAGDESFDEGFFDEEPLPDDYYFDEGDEFIFE